MVFTYIFVCIFVFEVKVFENLMWTMTCLEINISIFLFKLPFTGWYIEVEKQQYLYFSVFKLINFIQFYLNHTFNKE